VPVGMDCIRLVLSAHRRQPAGLKDGKELARLLRLGKCN
jgi:hypothetical protein